MEALNHSFGTEVTWEGEERETIEKYFQWKCHLERLEEAAEQEEGYSRTCWPELEKGKGRLRHDSEQIVLIIESTGALQNSMLRNRFCSDIVTQS